MGRERRHEGAVNIWMFAQFSQLVLRSKSFCTTASSRVIFRRTVETSQIWSNCCSDYLVSVRVCVFVHVMALLSSKAEKWYTYTTHSFPQKGMVCSLIVCSFPKNSLGVLRQFSFFPPPPHCVSPPTPDLLLFFSHLTYSIISCWVTVRLHHVLHFISPPFFFKLSSSTSLFTRWQSFQIEGNETQRRPTTAFQAVFWKSQSRCTSLFLATWLIHTVNDLEDQRIISSTDNSPPHLPQHVISIQH